MPDEFKGELRRILGGFERLEVERLENPASHGWLRRPEFDRPGVDGWERPDGKVVGIETGGPATGDPPP